jgi:hypothetical protein
MLMHNTRESAIRRVEFHDVLQQWLDESFDDQAGDPGHHGGPAWLWVRHGGEHYYLHAASTRSGIREYLRLIAAAGSEIAWNAPSSTAPLRERVTLGQTGGSIEGFDLFRHVPRR